MLQIESIASFWFTRAPVAPTSPSELGDRAFLVTESPEVDQKRLGTKIYSETRSHYMIVNPI